MPGLLFAGATLAALVGVLLPLLASYFFGGQITLYLSSPYGFRDIPDQTGKIAIVTGSNTGIGYVTARELARKGAKVIVAARNVKKGEDAVKRIKAELGDAPGARQIEFMNLDLSSFASVKVFADEFKQKDISLDMLILNAGVMAPAYGLTTDGLETQIGTNHFGHFLLVKCLTPLIKSSKTRVVHVSSMLHAYSYPEGIRFDSFSSGETYDPIKAYGQSKLANVLFSNELAAHLNGTGATSNCLHPGFIKTELSRHMEEDSDKNPILKSILSPVAALVEMAQLSADNGALTQLYVATSPALLGVNGAYYEPIARTANIGTNAQNATLQTRLWEESEKLTMAYW